MSYLPLIDLKNGFWPVVHLLYGISEWNFTDMLNIKGYIFLVRTVTLTFPVHELSALDWSEKWFLTCSSFTIWSIWMKLHRYVDHQRLHIVTKDLISLSISVLLLFRHYISHKITFGAPSSDGVLCSACGAFIYSFKDEAKNKMYVMRWPFCWTTFFCDFGTKLYSWDSYGHLLCSLGCRFFVMMLLTLHPDNWTIFKH